MFSQIFSYNTPKALCILWLQLNLEPCRQPLLRTPSCHLGRGSFLVLLGFCDFCSTDQSPLPFPAHSSLFSRIYTPSLLEVNWINFLNQQTQSSFIQGPESLFGPNHSHHTGSLSPWASWSSTGHDSTASAERSMPCQAGKQELIARAHATGQWNADMFKTHLSGAMAGSLWPCRELANMDKTFQDKMG